MIYQQIGGVILTRMRWNKPQWWLFNISLLIYQLVFLAWGYRLDEITRGILRIIFGLEAFTLVYYGLWNQRLFFGCLWIFAFVLFTLLGPNARISLSKMIEAAQYCHVRLCIREHDGNNNVYEYISFTAPRIEFDYFTPGKIAGSNRRWTYLDPNFELDELQRTRLYQAAEHKRGDLRARLYDYLQLLSFVAHLPLWMIYPPWWGKELFKTLNLPGGRTVCSAGVIELLRFVLQTIVVILKGYDTPMVAPCLIAISEHWSKG